MIQFFEESEVSLRKSNVADQDVALAAWVSTYGLDADERLAEEGRLPGLINYLMRESHETPFENAGSMTFYIKTCMPANKEHLRHRIGWSYNEISGRYAEYKPHFYLPPTNRPLVQTGKVGQYKFEPGTDYQVEQNREMMKRSAQQGWIRYQHLINIGIANEMARFQLPPNLMTEYITSANPRSIMNFLTLRVAGNAFFEIRDVAEKIERLFAAEMPLTYAAWKRYADPRYDYKPRHAKRS